MHTPSGTVTVWQSGRLAPHLAPRRLALRRDQALGAGLLLVAAVVLALYVAVLERDVARGELLHEMQRGRAVAEARCEADRPALTRGGCIALFNGDEVAASPPDAVPAYMQENAARSATVSLLATAR